MKTEKDFLEYLKEIEASAAALGFDSLDETFAEHLRHRFFGEDVVVGQTERVLLREIRLSDLEVFYGFSDAESEPVLKVFLKESREESAHFLKRYIEHMYPMYDCGIWTAERLEDGKIIGLCGLGKPEISGEECTDIGYYICPECRNQGYASECIGIALDYADDYLEIPQLYALIREENTASRGLAGKSGFEDTGRRAEDGSLIYKRSCRKGRFRVK